MLLTQPETQGALCPVCGMNLPEIPIETNFKKSFKDQKHKNACTRHVSRFHSDEPIWNALPKMDLDSKEDQHVSSQRQKSQIASVEGLVQYGLSFSARAFPLAEMEMEAGWVDIWHNV